MMTRPRLFLTGGLAGAAIATVAALAAPGQNQQQTIDGMDIAKIRARAQAVAKEEANFAREISRRGDAVRQQAVQVRERALANAASVRPDASKVSQQTATGMNLDEMLADSKELATASTDQQPRFIAFASLSMPPASLRQLMRDVGGAGGIVVFRGFPQNSVKAFMAGIGRSIDKGQKLNGVGIDPRLFRAFNVTAVPTYVVVSTDFRPCDGFNCQTAVPPHDRMVGNVTPDYALRTFAAGGGPGARIARTYLTSLQRLNRQ